MKATRPAETKPRTLDVRPFMARGEQLRAKIMSAFDALKPDQDFVLIAPFLPAPLTAERRADGSWQTRFSRGRTSP